MKVTDEMISAAYAEIRKAGYIIHHMPVVQRAIKAAVQAGWVSVDDYLPDEYDDLIVLDEDMNYSYAYRKGENWVSDSNVGVVTHWMPLPSYKEPTP